MSNGDYSARIICCYGEIVIVENDAGELRRARPKKKILPLVCGDRVSCIHGAHDKDTVTALETRTNLLTRQSDKGTQAVAANIDQCMIVIAYLPPPQSLLVDHYLIACANLGVRPILVLNKTDLREENNGAAIENFAARYRQLGCTTLKTSVKTGDGLAKLAAQAKDHTNVLTGQSGVGKSSLATKLGFNVEARVGAISQVSGAGRHTTSTTTLYHLKDGGDLIDSPGIRSYAYPISDMEDIYRGFSEFSEHAATCRFRNCTHIKEPDCGVKQALERRLLDEERYQNYRAIAGTLSKTN